MRLVINHAKYTHVDIRGYRERINGATVYYATVVPVIVDGICVRTEAYAGFRVTLHTCKRASHSAECEARKLAAYLLPEVCFDMEREYGFEVPDFNINMLTFTVC